MENRNKLGLMKIKDVMHLIVKNPTIISPKAKILDLLEAVNKDLKTRHVYVSDNDNKLIGSVRMNTIVKYLFPTAAIMSDGISSSSNLIVNIHSTEVEEIMKKDPFYVTPDATLSSIAILFITEKINELPVVDEQLHIIGQINVYEIIEAYKNIT